MSRNPAFRVKQPGIEGSETKDRGKLFIMKKHLITAIKVIVVVAIFYFIGRSVNMKVSEILDYLLHTGPFFTYSLLTFIVFICAQAVIWITILNHDGAKKLSYYRGMVIYFNSQFAKYLPGGFWNFVGRVYMTSRYGVPMNQQLVTLVYENLLLIVVASTYGLIMLYASHVIALYVLLLAFFALLMSYFYYGFVSRTIEKLIKRTVKKFSDMRLTLPKNSFFLFMLYSFGSHLIMGFAFWLLLQSFGVHNVNLLEAAGTYALAWLLGFITPLPGGIGVREGMLTFLLSFQHIGGDVASHISIISRIWNILAEVIVFLILNGFEIILKKRKHVANG